MLALADAHGLRHFISEDAGRCDQRRVELLLALGVGSHRRDMGAGLHLIAHQDRREARRDGDDDIGFGAETLKGDRLEGQPNLGRRLGEARQHLGVRVERNDFGELALLGGARS